VLVPEPSPKPTPVTVPAVAVERRALGEYATLLAEAI
jgi:hypothetical protein